MAQGAKHDEDHDTNPKNETMKTPRNPKPLLKGELVDWAIEGAELIRGMQIGNPDTRMVHEAERVLALLEELKTELRQAGLSKTPV